MQPCVDSPFPSPHARMPCVAHRCLNTILSYIHRVKQLHARNSVYDQILKKNEQVG